MICQYISYNKNTLDNLKKKKDHKYLSVIDIKEIFFLYNVKSN